MSMLDLNPTGLVVKLIAGGGSCMLTSAMLNPMDVIKVRLQIQQPDPITGLKKYQGFTHAVKTVFKEEGYRKGLMRGTTPSVAREAIYSSLRLGLYDDVKIMVAGHASKDEFTLGQKILAGCITGAGGSMVATPLDLIKTRFQSYTIASPNPYAHLPAALIGTYRAGGLSSLYRGATPTMMRAAVLTSSQLASYDHSKRTMIKSGMKDDYKVHLIASLISGFVTTTAVNPVDIVRTRYMVSVDLYKNPIDCLIKTVRADGLSALMRGWMPNYARLGPHFVVSLPLAEYIRKSLGAEPF